MWLAKVINVLVTNFFELEFSHKLTEYKNTLNFFSHNYLLLTITIQKEQSLPYISDMAKKCLLEIPFQANALDITKIS